MPQAFDMGVAAELLAQIVTSENQRASGVFLFAIAQQVRGIADLGFHLLFAIPKIIVRDNRDNDAAFVAAGELEGSAVVVEFILLAPAHAVAALPFRRLVPVRQS